MAIATDGTRAVLLAGVLCVLASLYVLHERSTGPSTTGAASFEAFLAGVPEAISTVRDQIESLLVQDSSRSSTWGTPYQFHRDMYNNYGIDDGYAYNPTNYTHWEFWKQPFEWTDVEAAKRENEYSKQYSQRHRRMWENHMTVCMI